MIGRVQSAKRIIVHSSITHSRNERQLVKLIFFVSVVYSIIVFSRYVMIAQHNTTNTENNQNMMETVFCFNIYIVRLFHRNNVDPGRQSNFEIKPLFAV